MTNIFSLLEQYFRPSEPEDQVSIFSDYHNNDQYNEISNNVTQADVYDSRNLEILTRPEQIK